MQVRITMHYDVPASDQDDESKTGLTSPAYDELHDQLGDMGMDDITIELVSA